MRTIFLMNLLSFALIVGCKNGRGAESATDVAAVNDGCDHDHVTRAELPHTWPYPEQARSIRWGNKRTNTGLKLRPRDVAIRTATVRWEKGERIDATDSHLVITKPRRVIAKHDMEVTREVWDQGRRVQKTAVEVRQGEPVLFLFYDSRTSCLIATEDGPGWTGCTLDGSFEGLSTSAPVACEQDWWAYVRLGKVKKGWFLFDDRLMSRITSDPVAP